jgi:integrase
MCKRVNARQPAWPAGDRLLDRALGRQDEKLPIANRSAAHRDGTMILLAYRHGLRAQELLDLRWGAARRGSARPCRRLQHQLQAA